MPRIALIFAVWLAGCAQLAGIDNTTGGNGSAGLSLSFERVSLGATNVREPQDLSGSHATFLVSDDADPSGLVRVPSELSVTGAWTAPLRDTTAAVLFDLPDFPAPIQRIFDYPNPAVKGLYGVMEHPNPEPAPAGATITVNVTLDVPYAGEGLQLFTAGSWNQRGLEPPAAGATALAPPPFLMTSMASITGRPHERITGQDGVVVLRYVGNRLAGALAVPAFEQTGTDTITGTLGTVLANTTLDIGIDQAAAAQRLAACRPTVGNLAMQWALRAAPGWQFNNDNGPLLNAAAVTLADPPKITATYGNPFSQRGWLSTFTWVVTASRVYTPPSANLPVTLVAQMSERALPDPGLMLKLPVGLPELITLDGKSLSSDGLAIAKPTKAVDVSFVTDLPDNTFYQLQLFELVPNMTNTALELRQMLGAAGVAPKFRLPPELFKPGSLYTLRAVAVQGGFPTLGDGDLTRRELPIAVSLLDSGVFQVMP